MPTEQWIKDFETFLDKSVPVLNKFERASIFNRVRNERTAAQVSLLETILREDVPEREIYLSVRAEVYPDDAKAKGWNLCRAAFIDRLKAHLRALKTPEEG